MSALGSAGGNDILAIYLPALGQTVKTKDKTQRFSIYNFHQHIKVCNFLEVLSVVSVHHMADRKALCSCHLLHTRSNPSGVVTTR